jgi:glutamate---cysteine ligase / carboxylate-amine ligase
VSGLHVHVGMPDAETAMAALEGVLPWLPIVLALSANSPYLAGAEAGMLSARAEVLSLLPRRGAPPAFDGYGGWERFVERLVASGLVRDYTAIWWDVRPHPRFGTLEIRMPDQPTSVAFTGAFVALLQALCKTLAEGGPPRGPAERGDYQQNRWAAARFGPRAQLIRPDGDRAVPVDALFGELSDLVGPTARELGSADLLVLDPAQCEADRQLEIGRRDGLDALCADLVERSLASA